MRWQHWVRGNSKVVCMKQHMLPHAWSSQCSCTCHERMDLKSKQRQNKAAHGLGQDWRCSPAVHRRESPKPDAMKRAVAKKHCHEAQQTLIKNHNSTPCRLTSTYMVIVIGTSLPEYFVFLALSRAHKNQQTQRLHQPHLTNPKTIAIPVTVKIMLDW